MKFSTLGQAFAALIIGLCLILVSRPEAQSAGSFLDLDIEYSELKVTLERILEENKQLRTALGETGKSLAEMRRTFAASNDETAIIQRQTTQMKLRMDALGVEAVAGNNAKLEQRLLAAVNDLRVTAAEKAQISEALVRIVEAASLYARSATATNPQSRLNLETEIRNANAALGGSSNRATEVPAVPSTMTDGMVISVKDDLSLVVMNLGRKQGVSVGTPFQVIRKDKEIGVVRVVDVREKIAGAVIQNLNSEEDRIKQGDLLKVDARQ